MKNNRSSEFIDITAIQTDEMLAGLLSRLGFVNEPANGGLRDNVLSQDARFVDTTPCRWLNAEKNQLSGHVAVSIERGRLRAFFLDQESMWYRLGGELGGSVKEVELRDLLLRVYRM